MREKRHKIYIGGDEYDLSDLDNSLLRNEIFEKLKNNKYNGILNMSTDVDDSIGCEHVNIDKNAQSVHTGFHEGTQCVSFTFTDDSHNKYRDLVDMVHRLQLTFDEIVDILNINYVAGSTKGYTLLPGVNKNIDINFMLKSLLPKEQIIQLMMLE